MFQIMKISKKNSFRKKKRRFFVCLSANSPSPKQIEIRDLNLVHIESLKMRRNLFNRGNFDYTELIFSDCQNVRSHKKHINFFKLFYIYIYIGVNIKDK